MLETEKYKEKLTEVFREIDSLFDVAEIRGNDASSFIFAGKENRAIEIYQSKDAVIVEFWENEKQQTEVEVDSYDKAAKLVADWING